MTLLGNDLPDGAVTLPVGGGCTGPVFTNAGGTYSPGEPPISCRGTNINSGSIVWYKFVAPASGFVRVSTDVSGNNLDTKLGLFTTSNPSNPSDLASFSIIATTSANWVETNEDSNWDSSSLMNRA